MKKHLPPDAGIAIGPILFVIALLGILAAFMASSGGGFSVAGVADRVTADIHSQANLIRMKINECNIMYGTADNGDGWPSSDPSDGTAVADLECTADPVGKKNLWTGTRPAMLPPTPQGFSAWTYMNAGATGGRCFWTAPTGGNSSSGVVSGLTRAASKFSSQEVSYNAGSAHQKFVVFLTLPTGTVDPKCDLP